MKNLLLFSTLLLNFGCSNHKTPNSSSLSLNSAEAKFAISTSEPLVAEVGVEIFKSGGNIMDVAVATSFAISVVRPQSTGIGGGGFLLYKPATSKKTLAFDFREIAPRASTADMYLDAKGQTIPNQSQVGTKAVAVPGVVAGLYDLHKRYGKLSWEKVLQPSIQLAESKVPVSKHMARWLESEADSVEKDPQLKEIFFKRGRPLREGETFLQKNLAKTLKEISILGKKYFYEGDFAVKLVNFMKENGGIISLADLSNYKMKERKPLQAQWRQYSIVTFPPPSSGGVHLIQILKIYDAIPESFKQMRGSEVAEIEAMKRAFIDRAYLMGDPDFAKLPLNDILSPSYFKKRATEISTHEILPSASILPWTSEKLNHETTHISIIDADGNSISTTQSVNGYFGAKVSVPGTGVILNNTMDDFSIQPGTANYFGLIGGKANRIQPAKRPLSSMTPTLILNAQGKPIMVIGAPGGSRIITGIYYVLSRTLREHQSPAEAISGCRFHHQWMPDQVLVERECLDTFKAYEKFYKIVEPSSPFGPVQIVGKNENNELYSIVDPRSEGVPALAK